MTALVLMAPRLEGYFLSRRGCAAQESAEKERKEVGGVLYRDVGRPLWVSSREHAAPLWRSCGRTAGGIPGILILTLCALKTLPSTLEKLLKISKSFSLHGLHVLISTILEFLRFKILLNSRKVVTANPS